MLTIDILCFVEETKMSIFKYISVLCSNNKIYMLDVKM